MNTHDPILAIGPLGTTEMLIIFVMVLLLFGAKRLPTLARSIGKSLGEFRKAKDEFQEEITRGEDEGASEYEKKRSAAPKPRPQQIPTEASKNIDAIDAEKVVDHKGDPTTTSASDSKPA